ncbi:MAG: ABC transporter permease [Candidatus Brocadiae bacterium]|nr:ABC transporter permease [Candidatus Brocadiia bacterium]
MKGFLSTLRWNFFHLFQNRYTMLFVAISFLPVLVCIFFQIYPEMAQNTYRVYPDQQEYEFLQSPEQTTPSGIPYKLKTIKLNQQEIFSILSYRFLLGFILLFGLCCLGSKAIGEEVELGTLQMLFLRPINRKTIYISKGIALTLTGLAIALLPLLSMFFLIFRSHGDFLIFFQMIFIYILGILSYSSVFLFIGMFKGGLYLALLYAFFWEFMIVAVTERARKFAISHYLESMVFDLIGQRTGYMSSFWDAAFVLVCVSFVMVVFGIACFDKKEFSFS